MTSWFFIEMAAKSALICGVALLLALAIRNRAASDRARVLRIGVGLLLALPLIGLAFPSLQIAALCPPEADKLVGLTGAELQALMTMDAGAPAPPASIWDDPAPLILLLWAAGALIVAARLAIGLCTLHRWTRLAEPVTDPIWLDALERARASCGASDRLRLLVADRAPGPLGWGFRNPVILIDVDTHVEREDADAILMHEVAHVARGDWPALMATRVVTALFWFNPLVWVLAREAVQQAEEAADAHAAHVVEPTRYAETLLNWAQIGRGIAVPANSIAPARGLTRRVQAVLEPKLRERSAGSMSAVMAMIVCAGIAAPVSALELVEAARPERASQPRNAMALNKVEPDRRRAAPLAPHSPAPAASEAPPVLPAAAAAPKPSPARAAPAAQPAPAAPDPAELVELVAPAMESVRMVLPEVPMIVAAAADQLHSLKLVHAVHDAGAIRISRADLQSALARASAEMPGARRIEGQIAEQVRERQRTRAHARSRTISGARGMLHGADSMERGAADMEAQVVRLRDRKERERIIDRERERGHTVTHDQLLEAAEEMEDGARDMRRGARQMRRSAREMMTHH